MSTLKLAVVEMPDVNVPTRVTSSPLNKPSLQPNNNTLLSEQLIVTGCLWSESEPTISSPLSPHRLSCSQQSLPREYNLSKIKPSHSTYELEEHKEQFSSTQLAQESYSLHSLPLQTKLSTACASTKSCWTLNGPTVPSDLLQNFRARQSGNSSMLRSRTVRRTLSQGDHPVQLIYVGSFTFVCVCMHEGFRLESVRRSDEVFQMPRRPTWVESPKLNGGIVQRMRSFLSSRRRAIDKQSTDESNSARDELTHRSGSPVACISSTKGTEVSDTSRGSIKNLHISRSKKPGYSNASFTELVITCDNTWRISLATKQAIDRLRQELQASHWDDQQCQLLTELLKELSNLIPCSQFATAFIKAGGHEVIFRLVETFKLISDQTPPTPLTPTSQQQKHNARRSSVWSALMSCLAELSEYGINSADDEFVCESKATVNYSWDESIQTNYPLTGDENDRNPDDDSCFVCPVFNPTLNELFSWHLVSDLFLSVIIQNCWTECDMVALKNELKVLLKILINCPARANAVIDQTGPEFVFDRLQTVHELTLEFNNDGGPSTNIQLISKTDSAPNQASNRSSLSSADGSTHWISGPSAAGTSNVSYPESLPDWCSNPCRNELITLLLEFVYIVLYRAHITGKLSVIFSDYLNFHTLHRLVTYLPQLRIRNDSSPVECESHWNGKRGGTLKRHVNIGHKPSTAQRNSLHRGESNFFYQAGTTSKPNACKSTDCVLASDPNPIIVLARLQRLHFALLAEEAKTMVDLENPCVREQIRHWLLQACASDRAYLPLIDEQLSPLVSNSQPASPTESTINPGPQLGRLHLNCLRAFLIAKAELVPQILSYGRSRTIDISTFDLKCSRSLDRIVDKQNLCQFRRNQSDLSNDYQRDVRRKTHTNVFMDQSSDDLTFFIQKPQAGKPMFPLIEVSAALTQLLCHILAIDGRVDPLNQTLIEINEPTSDSFHAMFFRPRTTEITSFEDLFVTTMCVFFYAWTQLNAEPEDLNGVLLLLREQLLHVFHQSPTSLDEFEKLLNQRTPQVVLAEWKDFDQIKRDEMQQSHPVLKDLNAYLTMTHQDDVREQRLNAMAYSAPLEYIPQKGQRQQGRDNVKYQVFLSPERNSLILYDQKQCIRDLWPLACIERVTTGTEERLKKNPERTIVLRVTIRDTSEQDEWSLGLPSQPGRSHTIQPQLVARTTVEYNYWIDGLYILRMVNRPSEQFAKDIQRLVALDMKLRISGLDLSLLPSKPQKIPLDPPEFDFDQP